MAYNNVPKFSMTMHVLLSNRIRTKRNNILKSNHSWTVWEIMTLYAFVSTVKYTKEYWMSATYKITDKKFIVQHVSLLTTCVFSKAESSGRFLWATRYNCEKNTKCYNLLVQMHKNYYIFFLISSSSSSKNSSNILWTDNPIHVATYCEENVWGWRQRVARQCR